VDLRGTELMEEGEPVLSLKRNEAKRGRGGRGKRSANQTTKEERERERTRGKARKEGRVKTTYKGV